MKREEAIKRGRIRFTTGKPCKNGHRSERYTSSGACCECVGGLVKKAREIRKGILERTATVNLFVHEPALPYLRDGLDAMVTLYMPGVDPLALNPYPFKKRCVGPAVYKLVVRVPAGCEEMTFTLGRQLWEWLTPGRTLPQP